MKYLITLSLLLFLSVSAFAVDLTVTGISDPSAANGTYVPAGTFNGQNSWVHSSGGYYIYYYVDAFDQAYWIFDITRYPSGDFDYGIFNSGEGAVASSPTTVSSWSAVTGTGSPTVAEVSVNPEINIKANSTSIVSGDASASFADFTKFGSALPNSGSATRTFTIENTGAAALTVGTISFSGANNSDFSVTSSPASSVAASGSTTFTVTFAPTGTGSRDATISIVNSDSDENPYTFALNGYGYTAKTLVVSGITTPEAANGNYIHQGVINNFEYWKHATENYYIFNNLSTGIRLWYIDTNLDYTDGDLFYKSSESPSPSGLTGWAALNGIGSPTISETTPTPEINVVGNNSKNIVSGDNSPKLFYGTNFGSLDYASGTRTRTFTIQNTGTAALSISDVTITGTDASQFTVTTTPATSVAASESTTFVVTFDPTSVGTKTATVTINNNDSDEGTYTFSIQGDGFTAKSLVVSGITTPSAANGTYTYQGILNEFQYWKHSSQDYYIYNTVEYESYHWHIDTNTEAAAGTSAYNFRSANNGENVSPVNVSAWSATSGNEGSPSVVYAEPEINVTGNSVAIVDGDATPSIYDHTDFGWITSGSVVRTYTIQNLGTETLTLTGSSPYVVIGGTNSADFSVTTPPSATIAAGGSTTFQVTATPSALGTRSATLSIANTDAVENPFNFSIQVGLGISPVVTTQAVSNIGTTNAIGNGNITTLGSPDPTSHGICYGATINPDVTGSKVDKGTASATGAFTAQLTGLTAGTTYHARAYATNSVGTVYGDDVTFTTTATMTEPGNALNFDGTNDYVEATDIDNSLTAFTIEAWVKWTPSASTDVQFICGKGIEQMEIHTGAGANDLRFIPTTGVYLDADNVLPTGVWTHIAAVYQPSTTTAKLYINGIEVSLTKSGVGTIGDAIGDNSTPFNLGRRSDNSYFFKGSIDEVRVWNTVRSQSDVQSDMVTAISSASGLLCSYNFNEGTTGSTMLPDLTSNGNNGTLTNFALTGTTSNWVESYAMVVPTATSATSITTTGFTANWTAPATGTVNNYKLYVATDAAFTSLVSGYNPLTVASGSTSSAVTGLAANATYYYRVCADKTSVTGEGAYSNSINLQTLPVAPTVTTQAVSNILLTTATGNGNITALGVPDPTQYGVVWDTVADPTVALATRTEQGAASETGAFTSAITGLTANTLYHVRAYATNTAGTSYGDDVTFTTLTAGTFTGATSTDWNTSGNWAGGDVPGSGTDVTIPSGKTVVIAPTASADCNNLTIEGSLTIESSASNTGSLIVSGTLTGTATVQRYVTTGGWRLIASPVTGQTIGSFLTDANAILLGNPSAPTNKAMKDYNEGTNNWNGLTYYTTTLDQMNANKGYAVWPTSDGSVSFTGTLQSGNVNVSVVRTGYGWNCIGNPYTSAIAINSAASATNNFIDINQSDPSKFANSYEAIYVWNQNAGSYDIVNHGYTGGAYYIPVGQAFFVRAASADLFSFTPAMQSHQNGAPFKSASVEWPTISINATANAKSSKALVKFNPEMSRGLDVGYDAGVMKTGFEVYTRLVEDNGVDFGLQCLPLVESEGMVIPVGIESTETGAVSLLVTASNLPEGFVAMLEDRQRGTILPVTDEGVTLEVAEGGTQANRFFLHVGSVTNVGRVSDWGKRITVLQGNGKLKVSGIDIRGCTATLYDVQGRKLLTSKLDIDTVISTEGFINGIYLLEVKQQGNVITKRVAVKN